MSEAQNGTQEVSVNTTEPIVQQGENGMFTTSLIIAEAFEKEHKDVLKAISNLECSPEFNERNFAPVEYKDAKGEMRPAYRLTRDGFAFLAITKAIFAAFRGIVGRTISPERMRFI